MTLFGLVRANLFRKPLRLALTLFAVFIAFFLFLFLIAFDRGLNAGVDLASADRLVVNNKINFTQPLPYAYVNRVAQVEHVVRVSHQNWFGAYYQEPRPFFAGFAVDPESFLAIYDEYQMPEEQKQAFYRNRRGAVLGRTLAAQLGFELGDLVPISSNIYRQADGSNSWDMEIVGIYEAPGDRGQENQLLFHYDYFNETQDLVRDSVGSIIVQTSDPSFNEEVARTIDAQFENSRARTETQSEAVFQASFAKQIGNIGLVITSIAGAATFIILVIVGNTMSQAIRERTKEIGVMKALGFKARTIVTLVIAESLLLVAIGALLGCGLGILMTLGAQSSGLPLRLVIDGAVLVQAAGLALALALVTAIAPAISAYQQPIASAFRRI